MRLLITAPYTEKKLNELKERFNEIFYYPWKPNGRAYNEKELIDLLKKTEAQALITEHDDVSENVIESFPNLEFIGVCRGTPSNVAIDVADKLGITVFTTPARNAQAVAEMFICNVIMLLRKTIPSIKWLEGENWEEGAHTSYLQFKGNELAGNTIGMVGFGAVGQRIAELVQGFPCKIQFYDPYIKDWNKKYKNTTLDDVFKTSDIVSIHLPVNDNTVGFINKTHFSKMKKNALFINTARACVVNQQDLLNTLENKEIRGAYLDVFYNEPPDLIDYKIIHLPNVLGTPHIAGATYEVEAHHSSIMNNQIFNYYLKKVSNIK